MSMCDHNRAALLSPHRSWSWAVVGNPKDITYLYGFLSLESQRTIDDMSRDQAVVTLKFQMTELPAISHRASRHLSSPPSLASNHRIKSARSWDTIVQVISLRSHSPTTRTPHQLEWCIRGHLGSLCIGTIAGGSAGELYDATASSQQQD